MAIFAQAVCALAIIPRVFTQDAAIPLVNTMLVAALLVHRDDPFRSKEFVSRLCHTLSHPDLHRKPENIRSTELIIARSNLENLTPCLNARKTDSANLESSRQASG